MDDFPDQDELLNDQGKRQYLLCCAVGSDRLNGVRAGCDGCRLWSDGCSGAGRAASTCRDANGVYVCDRDSPHRATYGQTIS
jgi:hypothetical protein